MKTESIHIGSTEVKKLLHSLSADAALLYIYIHAGNDPDAAASELSMSSSRYSCAAATLRQLGMWPQEKHQLILSGERPSYSEKDVMDAMDEVGSFRLLYGEVQRLLGRSLNTEELKILLGFDRYLGLPAEVMSVLVSYCKVRARQKGSLRTPRLRTIEKEAYHWAEQGIDSLEEAAAYIHSQNARNSRLSHLMGLLQIRGRNLTQAEERYAIAWLVMGFPDEAIVMAYERTCLNTGGMSWPYMNQILARWKDSGLKTGEQIRSAAQHSAESSGQRQLDADEQAAIAKMLQEV